MAEQPQVRVGQVWEDADPRYPGRRLKILRLDEDKARVYRGPINGWQEVTTLYAIVRRVTGPNNQEVGRYTRIRLDRFQPTSTGYRLVEDVSAEARV